MSFQSADILSGYGLETRTACVRDVFVLHKREMEAPIISHHTLSSAAATLSLFLLSAATARRIA